MQLKFFVRLHDAVVKQWGLGMKSPSRVWDGSPNVFPYLSRKYPATSAPSAMRYQPNAVKLFFLI